MSFAHFVVRPFFVTSHHNEIMTEANISGVEIAPLREVLRMYCRALSERSVELQDLQQLVDKNIGWSRADVATSDGAAIFLPAVIERFEAVADNFEFLKVMLTQQAGHIEFGSFEFQFDRPSTRFADLRPRLKPQPDENGHHHDRPTPTELTRFFRLFPNKRLALDIFAIVESARIEARVIDEYPGIAPLYRAMRARVLTVRHEMVFLPAREALLELLIRVSLGQSTGFKVPSEPMNAAGEIVRLLRSACAHGAAVEDAAEATLRIYAILSRVGNDFLEETQFAAIHIEDEGSSRSNRSNGSSRWEDDPATVEVSMFSSHATREKAYLSPQGVDYRGEFKPELAQLLSQPRSNSREERKSLTPEELAELLKSQHSPKPNDAEE